jgi:putative transposase
VAPTRINERWSLDFLLDTLEEGRRVRLLAVVDDFTRACLAIELDTSIGGRRVVEVLQRLVETRGTPKMLITDNGPNSSAGPSTPGRTPTVFGCISSTRASRTRTPTSKASMAGSATSVSMSTGFSAWPRRAQSSRPGAWTTMPFGPTVP